MDWVADLSPPRPPDTHHFLWRERVHPLLYQRLHVVLGEVLALLLLLEADEARGVALLPLHQLLLRVGRRALGAVPAQALLQVPAACTHTRVTHRVCNVGDTVDTNNFIISRKLLGYRCWFKNFFWRGRVGVFYFGCVVYILSLQEHIFRVQPIDCTVTARMIKFLIRGEKRKKI